MSKFNANHAKNIIREQVGFERKFINVLEVETNEWGAVEGIFFEVKGIYYNIEPDSLGGAILSFADSPAYTEPTEAEETEPTEPTEPTEEA